MRSKEEDVKMKRGEDDKKDLDGKGGGEEKSFIHVCKELLKIRHYMGKQTFCFLTVLFYTRCFTYEVWANGRIWEEISKKV